MISPLFLTFISFYTLSSPQYRQIQAVFSVTNSKSMQLASPTFCFKLKTHSTLSYIIDPPLRNVNKSDGGIPKPNTPFMVFSVTHYLELHNTITSYT